MTTSELDVFLSKGTKRIEDEGLSNPEDGLIDHGKPQDQVVKAWPTRDEAAAAEANLPLELRLREAQVRDQARRSRKERLEILLMENTRLTDPEPEPEKPRLLDNNEALLLSLIFAVAICALAWSLLPIFGWLLAAVGALLDQKYGTNN